MVVKGRKGSILAPFEEKEVIYENKRKKLIVTLTKKKRDRKWLVAVIKKRKDPRTRGELNRYKAITVAVVPSKRKATELAKLILGKMKKARKRTTRKRRKSTKR